MDGEGKRPISRAGRSRAALMIIDTTITVIAGASEPNGSVGSSNQACSPAGCCGAMATEATGL